MHNTVEVTNAKHKQRDAILIAGFALSGFTALGLELVWIKILGIAFGAWLVQRYLVRIQKPDRFQRLERVARQLSDGP